MRYLRFIPFLIVFSVLGLCQEPAPSPAAKHAPEAKSQEEYDAFMAISAAKDLAGSETAAEEFATKYPESELRATAFMGLMQRYRQANKADRILAMGRKTLSIEPENTLALVLVSSTLAEGTAENAPNRA